MLKSQPKLSSVRKIILKLKLKKLEYFRVRNRGTA